MASDGSEFIIDKEELKPGLILFQRTDVKHRNWYCRVKPAIARTRLDEEAVSPDWRQHEAAARQLTLF